MHLISLLKKNFNTISSSLILLKDIEKVALIQKFEKETVILKEDSYIQFIPLVISGLVKVYKEEENGNEVLLYILY